jgi:hypothetical protein
LYFILIIPFVYVCLSIALSPLPVFTLKEKKRKKQLLQLIQLTTKTESPLCSAYYKTHNTTEYETQIYKTHSIQHTSKHFALISLFLDF